MKAAEYIKRLTPEGTFLRIHYIASTEYFVVKVVNSQGVGITAIGSPSLKKALKRALKVVTKGPDA